MTTLELPIGARVSVHLNRTTKRWVIADKPRGRVRGHARDVTLEDVTFRVSEVQRRYCVAKRGRWVHAWALGTLVAVDSAPDLAGTTPVTYNPFVAPTFHVVGKEQPVQAATRAHFVDEHVFASETVA